MILRLTGEGSLTYCQNLCLIFFPGAKFKQDEIERPDSTVAEITCFEKEGRVMASAVLKQAGRLEKGESSLSLMGPYTRDRAIKLVIGHAVLEAGTRLLGAAPPWGILTGVRPAKVGAELSARLSSNEEVISTLITEYRVSPDKARLLSLVTEKRRVAEGLAGKGTCSFYVSIPFCPSRCGYCSFVSYATPRYLATIPAYLDRLCEDIRARGREITARGERITSVYMGGGTPTVLSAEQLDRVLGVIEESLDLTGITEFTVEAGRPDTITQDKLDILVKHGVDRTSINPQILDDKVLESIGRRHTVEAFYRAYDMAKTAGIASVNTDLIAGLPGASEATFCSTVDQIAKLAPENVTVHTYCVKRSASFTEEAAEQGDIRGIYSYNGSVSAACVDYAQKTLMSYGYEPYYLYRQKNAQGNLENVGYTLPGHEGLYNILIMEELQTIYAVGAGAVTKLVGGPGEKIKRIFEPKYSYEYLSKK